MVVNTLYFYLRWSKLFAQPTESIFLIPTGVILDQFQSECFSSFTDSWKNIRADDSKESVKSDTRKW